jgi:hypothetical protein
MVTEKKAELFTVNGLKLVSDVSLGEFSAFLHL